MNLSFDEIDSIITQGKELGVYMYIYTGGEPLVRKKDLIPTGIEAIQAGKLEKAAAQGIYTMDGKKLDKISGKGLYIINGKKVLKLK